MPNTIDRVATTGGTAIPDGGSTDQKTLIVSGASDQNQYIRIVDTPSGDSLGLSDQLVNGPFSIQIEVSKGRAYKIVADIRGGGMPSNEWGFRVIS
ncbi:hypothetical protein ACW9IO_28130 [Pseudomonas azotoformans]|uniref:hypothetical protein n=1 Tax=Pseudomonas sp. P7759 TaxID=2738831 RepID=UPI0015A02931|nr:hypothetical protein [Pseudomonas sp. P7759]NWC72643.1 hypothetical protein [Pseudomonas sp. P7759]